MTRRPPRHPHWVQKAGARIVDEEDELQTTFFEYVVVPPRDWTEREIVLGEFDGTLPRAQREERDKRKTRNSGR